MYQNKIDEIIRLLQATKKQLRNLFADKSDLRGFDDWDSLIGCVMALETAIAQLDALPESEENEQEE